MKRVHYFNETPNQMIQLFKAIVIINIQQDFTLVS